MRDIVETIETQHRALEAEVGVLMKAFATPHPIWRRLNASGAR